MYWLLLAVAIIVEITGTTCMKLSEGFTRLIPSLLVFPCYVTSIGLLTVIIRKIDVSLVYAIWSGVGTAVIAALGMFWFKEAVNWQKIVCITLIIIGVVGVNLAPSSE